MFNLPSLPRTLSAAQTDVASQRREVRQGAVHDLARLAATHNGGAPDDAVQGQATQGSAASDDMALSSAASDGVAAAACASLAELLEHSPFPDVRGECALALADVGARGALPALIRACDDVNERVREMALIAVGELVSGAESVEEGTAVLRVVDAALQASSSEQRFQAFLIAGRVFPESRLLSALATGLQDADALVRYRVMRVVEERWLSDDSARLPADGVRLLERGLRDASVPVRVAAALAARRIPETQSMSVPLAEALLDGLRYRGLEPEDEEAVIDAVGALQLQASVGSLRERAWGLFPHRFAWQAQIALARLGDLRARRGILRGLRGWARDSRTLAVVAAGRARLVEARPELLAMRGNSAQADQEAVEQALQELPEGDRR